MTLRAVSLSKAKPHEPRISAPRIPGRHDARFWTETELGVLRRYYPEGGASACLVHLPAHRTPSGVYGQAKKMGLATSTQAPHRGRYQASPGMDDRIREEWQQLDGRKKGEVNALADKLGVPRWWLSGRARTLGLTIAHKREPPWTAAEDALMARVPLHQPDKCAEIFREHGFARSPTAIVVRAKRINLSRRAAREELSAVRAAKILGVDSKFITRLILDGELPAQKRADLRRAQQGGSAWDIKPTDLRRFIIDRLELIDLRKVDKFEFVALIAGEAGNT
ncbi:hypothetical protein [Rhizobium leguminosarum]